MQKKKISSFSWEKKLKQELTSFYLSPKRRSSFNCFSIVVAVEWLNVFFLLLELKNLNYSLSEKAMFWCRKQCINTTKDLLIAAWKCHSLHFAWCKLASEWRSIETCKHLGDHWIFTLLWREIQTTRYLRHILRGSKCERSQQEKIE